MFDWSKESAPPIGPTTPGDTVPPVSSIPSMPAPQAPGDTSVPGNPDPWVWDKVGQSLFGRGNGSLLGGVPLLGDVVGAVGNAVSLPARPLAGGLGLIKETANRVPLGWLPGGADENFNQIGAWAKDNNPQMYETWQAVNSAANGDVLGGGNLKADFNHSAYMVLDDMTKEGVLGNNPTLAMGRADVGSLGGAFDHAVEGWLGLLGNNNQARLAATKWFDPRSDAQVNAGADTTGNLVDRIDQVMLRATNGDPLNPVEHTIAQHISDGSWTKQHAIDYIVSHGQGGSRDLVTQIGYSAIADPLTYLTVGVGAISKMGSVGAKIAESGLQAESAYEKLATVVHGVQQSQLGPAFRLARGFIDPLGVYKPTVRQRAVTDLFNGTALSAFDRAYGSGTIDDVRRAAREAGMEQEVDSAIAGHSIDQGKLMVAIDTRANMLKENLGEELAATGPDDIIEPMMHNASEDAVHRLTDFMSRTAKNTFTQSEDTSNAYRVAKSLGQDPDMWVGRWAKMSGDAKSAWNAITFKIAERDFVKSLAVAEADAAAAGEKIALPTGQMTLLTDSTLDDIAAQSVVDKIAGKSPWEAVAEDLRAGKDGVLNPETGQPIVALTREHAIRMAEQKVAAAAEGAKTIAAKTKTWNDAIRQYPALGEIGYAPGGQEQLTELVNELQKRITSGAGLSRRATDEELKQVPAVMDMIDRHTVNGERLWNVGFRPAEDVAWGLKRSAFKGLRTIDRDPTISHVIDAVPGRMRYTDTVRNFLGQAIGTAPAEAITRPVESVESFIRTSADMVSGQRLVGNIERRFEKSMFEKVGLPKPIIREIFGAAKDSAALDRTTLRGVTSDNIYEAIRDAVPLDFRLPNGHALDVHTVMDHLLQAAEGDLRIMGLTSKTSQRMRNIMAKAGLNPVNWMGQMTVTYYNKLRYSNPTFLIQRVTDGPYFAALYGVTPVGKGALKGDLAALRRIEENMGQTGMARDFAMDMPEYATRSNFQEGVRSAFEQKAIDKNWAARVADAPNALIANNMTAMLNARLGQIVKDTLDNTAEILKDADPETALRMESELKGPLARNFADWRAIYSESAGRVLDDSEVGLRYLQDNLNAGRRASKVGEEGIDMQGLLHETAWHTPTSVGEVGTIHPDGIAQELGYADAEAMRKDLIGTFDKRGIRTPGQHDIPWLEEQMRDTLHAHPDATRRAVSYFGGDWDSYWHRLSLPAEKGGLDVSVRASAPAQNLIAAMAKQRGMDPWEFLSGAMQTNLGGKDLDTAVGNLMGFLKSGADKQPLEAWTKVFRSQLDPSAQDALLGEFSKATGIETPGLEAAVKPASFTRDARGNAVLPAAFKHEPGYVYRIETLDAARSGWPERTGVSLKPNPIYVRGDEEAVLRVAKADHPDTLAVGRHGPGGGDRLTVGHTPPEHIEMLGADGQWHPLPPDPVDAMFESQFPQRVRDRITSGIPDKNPEVEAYIRHFTNWVQTALGPELAERTRGDLQRLVNAVPPTGASPFNRTQALVINTLKDNIRQSQTDVFRLAEMGTRRSVLERSLNHPLFGLYPVSYMYGKVLPETVKFIAKNPYAMTYQIAQTQRAIATQREYDPTMEAAMGKIDQSATAFLLDYLTPSLPWSSQSARFSPLVRDLFDKGGPNVGKIFSDEIDTTTPLRWFRNFAKTGSELIDAVKSQVDQGQQAPAESSLSQVIGQQAPLGAAPKPPETHGPVQATGLAPVLQDSTAQLEQTLFGK